MTRKITTLSVSLRLVEVVETDADETPSLPPMPVVETTGETVSESIRPLAKVLPFAARLKRLA